MIFLDLVFKDFKYIHDQSNSDQVIPFYCSECDLMQFMKSIFLHPSNQSLPCHNQSKIYIQRLCKECDFKIIQFISIILNIYIFKVLWNKNIYCSCIIRKYVIEKTAHWLYQLRHIPF